MFFAMYVLAWWYSYPLMKVLRTSGALVEPLARSCILPAVCFLALVFCIGHLDEQGMIPWARKVRTGAVFFVIDAVLVSLLVILLKNAVDMQWSVASRLAWLGKFSLGAYILHPFLTGFLQTSAEGGSWGVYFFSVNNHVLVPGLFEVAKSVGDRGYGTLQLLAMLLYALVFMATLAPLFQHFCIAVFTCIVTGLTRTAFPAIVGRFVKR